MLGPGLLCSQPSLLRNRRWASASKARTEGRDAKSQKDRPPALVEELQAHKTNARAVEASALRFGDRPDRNIS